MTWPAMLPPVLFVHVHRVTATRKSLWTGARRQPRVRWNGHVLVASFRFR